MRGGFFRFLRLLWDTQGLTERFTDALEVNAKREEVCDAVLRLVHTVSDFLTPEDGTWFMELLVQSMNDMARSIPNDRMSDSYKAWGSRIQLIFDLVLKLVDDATLEQFADAIMRIVRLLIDNVVSGTAVHRIDLWRPVLPFIKVLRQRLLTEFTTFPALPVPHFDRFAEMYEDQVAGEGKFSEKELNDELEKIRKDSRKGWEEEFKRHGRSFFAKV